MEKRKTEAMAAKCRRARGTISLSSKEKENYKSDTEDEMDPDQAGDDKNLLQLKERGQGKIRLTQVIYTF